MSCLTSFAWAYYVVFSQRNQYSDDLLTISKQWVFHSGRDRNVIGFSIWRFSEITYLSIFFSQLFFALKKSSRGQVCEFEPVQWLLKEYFFIWHWDYAKKSISCNEKLCVMTSSTKAFLFAIAFHIETHLISSPNRAKNETNQCFNECHFFLYQKKIHTNALHESKDHLSKLRKKINVTFS